MNQSARRQFLLLGCAVLAALSLSLYEKYGDRFHDIRQAMVRKTKEEEQMQKMEEENRRARENNNTQSHLEAESMAEGIGETETGYLPDEEKETANPDIRVLICSDDYQSEYHNSITIQATVPFTLHYQDTEEHYQAGDTLCLDRKSTCLAEGKAVLTLDEAGVFQLPLLKRSQSCPSYEGSFTVEKREEGLLLVNTLPLETYLCYVVPSEMPSSYPMEAQKAQAICARCYAMRQIGGERCAGFGADVDDSVSYQVYNNIGKTEESVQAVQETAGLIMRENGEIEQALYYSTSCGIRIEDELSEEAVFCSFLEGVREDDCEKEEPWYRWQVAFSLELMNSLVWEEYPGETGRVTDVTVLKRNDRGRVEMLQITGDTGSVCVEGEYAIRRLLRTGETKVILQDGSVEPQIGLLPSAFFYVTPQYTDGVLSGFLLNGGGYGHGDGMSQNGAKHMAEDGKSCVEILQYYYGDGVEVVCAT
ncbi:MAG: SpoIID/LytB domain-containing protein [Lachnospiraceae bacterium]|nr:SpoIID/LytB domain-containing protein [Lachnospiraceae bacterium]